MKTTRVASVALLVPVMLRPCGTGSAPSTASTGDPSAAHDVDGVALPGAAATTCSKESTTHSPLTIVNASTAKIAAWWVDYDCNEKYYGFVRPNGGQWTNNTFVTHPWRLRAVPSKQLLQEIPPASDATPRTIIYPTVASVALPGAAATTCSKENTTHSPLTIVNNSTALIAVWWVDFNCDEENFGIVQPNGGKWTNNAFVATPWRLRAVLSKQLLKEIPPASDATPRTISYP